MIIDDEESEYRSDSITCYGIGCKVIPHPLNGDWSQQRRFGISQAQSEWILFVDSDERVSLELAKSIQRAIQNRRRIGYADIIYSIIIRQPMVW